MRIIFQFIVFSLLVSPAWSANEVYKDIEATLGTVPSFFKSVPDASLEGAWMDMKGIQLNQMSALPGKYKELIGIAVAAQIPCAYCVYFHTEAAKLNKATDQEIEEALALSASVGRWSAVINGTRISEELFSFETDRMLKYISNQPLRQAQEERGAVETKVTIDTPKEAYEDIKKTFGFLPKFLRVYPKYGIVGAWKEMKNLELNPATAIPPKYKELISLAVASQTPSPHFSYFHKESAKLNEATKEEWTEAAAMAGITRHWSTILNGSHQNESAFRAETDKVMKFFRKNMVKEVTTR